MAPSQTNFFLQRTLKPAGVGNLALGVHRAGPSPSKSQPEGSLDSGVQPLKTELIEIGSHFSMAPCRIRGGSHKKRPAWTWLSRFRWLNPGGKGVCWFWPLATTRQISTQSLLPPTLYSERIIAEFLLTLPILKRWSQAVPSSWFRNALSDHRRLRCTFTALRF